jgi:hypothetical protein
MNSDSEISKLADGDDLTPHELVAIDALLSEAVGGRTPPDWKDHILERYHADPDSGDASSVRITPVSRAVQYADRRRRIRRNWAILSSLAVVASLAAFVWYRPSITDKPGFVLSAPKATTEAVGRPPQHRLAEATNAETLPAEKTPISDPPNSGFQRQNSARSGIVLVSPAGSDAGPAAIQEAKRERALLAPPAAVRLVSKSIEKDVRRYWESAGVQPTGHAEAAEVASRLSAALGVTVPPRALENHDSVAQWLTRNDVALAIARSWWTQVTAGNFKPLPAEDRGRLQRKFAKHLKTSAPFDEFLVGLVDGTDAASADFYASLAPPASEATHPDRIANLASLTMNVDVSCTRCHDSMVGENHGQQDYWGFAAAVAGGLKTVDGKLVRVDGNPAKTVFYESMDRQGRVANPRVPERWLGVASSTSEANSIADWSASLSQSRVLAAGVVNSLWKLVHGRPLSGQTAHPMAAPMSDELMSIQQNLVDDLVRSDFNIKRTLTLILMSPTAHRSTPESLRDVWATDQSDAHRKAIVFAGAVPPVRPISMTVKVDQSMLAIGAAITSGGGLLAQLGETGTSRGKVKGTESLAWDFPDHADGPPVQWLQSVRGVDAKIQHLCYLAGFESIPKPIRNAAQAMKTAGLDEATLLHRVWWIAQSQ